MNINEISVAYLEEKEQRRRASTVDGYKSSINLYILPEFEESEIETIEPEEIQAWVDGFEKPGAAENAFKCHGIPIVACHRAELDHFTVDRLTINPGFACWCFGC